MQRRYKRLIWTVALTMMGASYAACAWLWAAPYRARVGVRDPQASMSPAATGAGVAPPLMLAPAPSSTSRAPKVWLEPEKRRTPPLSNTRNF